MNCLRPLQSLKIGRVFRCPLSGAEGYIAQKGRCPVSGEPAVLAVFDDWEGWIRPEFMVLPRIDEPIVYVPEYNESITRFLLKKDLIPLGGQG
jgi:hypothetical protein